MLRAVVAILLVLLPIGAAERTYLKRIWQSEEGLPGNVVRSLGQTPDGFLWVATAEGLARFDGIEFKTYSGSGNYRGRRLGFFRIFTPSDGTVWVSTFRGGLYRVGENTPVEIIPDSNEPSPPLVTRLFIHQGVVHFVQEGALKRLSGKQVETVESPDPALAAAHEANRVAQERRNRVDNTDSPRHLFDRAGGRWTIRNLSLFYRAPGEEEDELVFPELAGRIIANDWVEDREGNLWIGTPVQGLLRVKHGKVFRLESGIGYYEHPVHTALQARDGTWWTGSRSGGVDRLRDGEVTHFELIPEGYPRPVTCIFQDSKDRLWFASRDGTVFEWTGEEFVPRFNRTPSVSKVNAIVEDRAGQLWFGGGQGLSRWNGESVESFGTLPVFSETEITTLALTEDQGILAGTSDGRIISFDLKEFTLLAKGDELGRRWITRIIPVSRDEIWASTIGSGIQLLRKGKWQRFDSASGLPDERITTLERDGEDHFWLGSLGGILRVSRTELLAYDGKNGNFPGWLRLDRSDGLLSRECVGGSQPGVIRDLNGRLWFPTANGLNGVNPDDFSQSSPAPEVHFTGFEVNGRPAPSSPLMLESDPGAASLTFRYLGLNLSAPEKVTYRVRLVGMEKTPRFVGPAREVSYESVPPGEYEFRVVAINGDGVASGTPAIIPIRVRPHFWQRPWFAALVTFSALAIALAIGSTIARVRMNRKLQVLRLKGALENERSRISRDLHDDLGASLTELSILSALATEEPEDAKLRPALAQLSRKAKNVVTTLDEIVWATTPEEDSLRSLVDYLTAFAREFLETADIRLHTEIERPVPEHAIGPRRRHSLLLATRESLNNAVKYSKAENLTIEIKVAEPSLIVKITDDGIGFNIRELINPGHGLKNLPKRMRDCGGDCEIDSERGKGTSITLTLPLRRV